ncbi:MAG TPA: hypothetical protein VKA70_11510 [Blastocatellia bacterium]|nr:hypothetical protein [Blastocatellia bacterium]
MKLLVLLEKRDIVITPNHSLFPRRHAMRFEWLALLAYTRNTQGPDGGWVSIEEIQKLPLWRGKPKEHIGTNVGRYIQQMEKGRIKLVEVQTLWRGPYRLQLLPWEVSFDIPIKKAGERLGQVISVSPSRQPLLLFTEKYSRAMSLFLEGRLLPDPTKRKRQQENALDKLCALAEDGSLDARLRLMANLAAVRVLDSLGRFRAAAMTLDECQKLIKRVRDPVVTAKYFLANAWRYYRARDYAVFEQNLAKAKEVSTKSIDSTLAGASVNSEGLYLAERRRYEEAIPLLVQGLDARLPIDNFDAIQASCFNIGNTFQRMGEGFYGEAEAWLKLCVNICKWMHLGRYESLAEVVLAKIALESGRTRSFLKWIREAEHLAEQARNPTDILWCHILWAFYAQQQKRPEDAIEHLIKARSIYKGKQDYDWMVLDKYVHRKFPDLWEDVINGK